MEERMGEMEEGEGEMEEGEIIGEEERCFSVEQFEHEDPSVVQDVS